MSRGFYSLSIDPRRQRLVFASGVGLRWAWGVALTSLTAALVPALLPNTGVVIEPEGWWPAGVLWALSVVGVGWRDRWVFEADRYQFRHERGWGPFVAGRSRPLKGFGGWETESVPGPFQDPSRFRRALCFRTAEGNFRLDGTFAAAWVDKERPALDLWSQWEAEGRQP